MNKNQAKAYAAVTLDILHKINVKITPKILAEEMDLIYDLYDLDEILEEYDKLDGINSGKKENISGIASCYIINGLGTEELQKNSFNVFCKNKKLTVGEIYITNEKENSEVFYHLVKDIRDRKMNILFLNIYTYYLLTEEELAAITKLCRKNNIIIVEI